MNSFIDKSIYEFDDNHREHNYITFSISQCVPKGTIQCFAYNFMRLGSGVIMPYLTPLFCLCKHPMFGEEQPFEATAIVGHSVSPRSIFWGSLDMSLKLVGADIGRA